MRASGCGAAGGGVAQPASRANARLAAPIEDNRAGRIKEEERLGWVFLEIGIALAIAVAIVWWTLPRKPKSPKEKDEP